MEAQFAFCNLRRTRQNTLLLTSVESFLKSVLLQSSLWIWSFWTASPTKWIIWRDLLFLLKETNVKRDKQI